ncbi:MAG: hypothetical protein M3Y59_11190 [Myxococcota bacterium]|nr:hypothetical protein [Myxococcota bacterium]
MNFWMRGCGLSLVAILFGGCHLLTDNPVANAGPDRQVPRNSQVTLDGSNSYGGQQLVYRWAVVSAPSGAAVILSAPQAAQTTFTASVEGPYVFALAVWRGQVFSEVDRVTITAINSTPIPRFALGAYAAVGETVTLDGTASADPDGDPVTHAWRLIVPGGSNSQPSDPAASASTFVPDVEGNYTALLSVSDGVNPSGELRATISVVRGMIPLGSSLVDAEYSHALDRLVLVGRGGLHSADGARLYVLVRPDPDSPSSLGFGLVTF